MKTQKEKLEAIIEILEKLPDKNFNMQNWILNSYSCGTIGCAIGWAALDKRFIEDGFYLKDGTPYYNCMSAWYAVGKYFELSDINAKYLFDAFSYYSYAINNKQEVINRIKEFLQQ